MYFWLIYFFQSPPELLRGHILKIYQIQISSQEILYKRKTFLNGYKKTPRCTFCNHEEDSVEHLMIDYPVSRALWVGIEEWINQLEVVDYNVSDKAIITGELEKSLS